MSSALKTQRLFFALWPGEQTRKAIAICVAQAMQSHQGKPMRIGNLHLTLAFLGNVDEMQRECIEAFTESISMASFSLCLDHFGIFPEPKVLWLGLKEQPDALTELASGLAEGARGCGLQLDAKYFSPHVSLMRKVDKLHQLKIKPIDWTVNEFCLLKSMPHPQGVEYQVVKSWPSACRSAFLNE